MKEKGVHTTKLAMMNVSLSLACLSADPLSVGRLGSGLFWLFVDFAGPFETPFATGAALGRCVIGFVPEVQAFGAGAFLLLDS